jgi:hypothetical protein
MRWCTFKNDISYLLTLDSSVSNTIRKRIPTVTCVLYTALWYFARGMINSEGLCLQREVISVH